MDIGGCNSIPRFHLNDLTYWCECGTLDPLSNYLLSVCRFTHLPPLIYPSIRVKLQPKLFFHVTSCDNKSLLPVVFTAAQTDQLSFSSALQILLVLYNVPPTYTLTPASTISAFEEGGAKEVPP